MKRKYKARMPAIQINELLIISFPIVLFKQRAGMARRSELRVRVSVNFNA